MQGRLSRYLSSAAYINPNSVKSLATLSAPPPSHTHTEMALPTELIEGEPSIGESCHDNESFASPVYRQSSEKHSHETGWWLASTAFPLIAGTFGPVANVLSICALVEVWRINPVGELVDQGTSIADPAWLIGINAVSLGLGVIANISLLLTFLHRADYRLAQPFTVITWLLSAALLAALIIAAHMVFPPNPFQTPTSKEFYWSQSYYYAIISTVTYTVISLLLAVNIYGAYVARKYPPGFHPLTAPQRTLMLQTMALMMYLCLGALLFSKLEGWEYLDGVYWCDYTILTIGLGSDFPLERTISRVLLFPYAAGGIVSVGLVIAGVRGLIVEKARWERQRHAIERKRKRILTEMLPDPSPAAQQNGLRPKQAWKEALALAEHYFHRLREVQTRPISTAKKMPTLVFTLFVYLSLWVGGAGVFWHTERNTGQDHKGWTFVEALYFSYTSLLTIGYGDFYPSSNAGKPFFLIWTILAVPTVAVLISNIQDMGGHLVGRGMTKLGTSKEANLAKKSGENIKESVLPKKRECEIHGEKDRPHFHELQDRVKSEEKNKLISISHASTMDVEQKLILAIRTVTGHMIDSKKPKRYTWDEWLLFLELLKGKNFRQMAEAEEKAVGEGETSDIDVGDSSTAADSRYLIHGHASCPFFRMDGPLMGEVGEQEWLLDQLARKLENEVTKRSSKDETESKPPTGLESETRRRKWDVQQM